MFAAQLKKISASADVHRQSGIYDLLAMPQIREHRSKVIERGKPHGRAIEQ